MNLSELYGDLNEFSWDDFKIRIRPYIFMCFKSLVDYYDTHLDFREVLSHYGVSVYDTDEQQVTCKLLEHGGVDITPSARFYKYDRETGKERHSVYCHKCNKLLTPFWYVYSMERDYRQENIWGVVDNIKKYYKIPFPRYIFNTFDPEKYQSDVDDMEMDVGARFLESDNMRETKFSDVDIYFMRVSNIS